MFIGDSQTMTAESAVLGTPALRFNDFVGELSYLEELEHVYGLTYGFKTNNVNAFYEKLDKLLTDPKLKEKFAERKKIMLSSKINFAKWMIQFMNDYPNSIPKKN
jgi:predicted glycosyltransferase